VANEKEMDDDLLKHVDHFIACSNYIASWIHTAYGIPGEKIVTIYTGADTNRIRPVWELPDIRRAMRSEFGLNEDDIVVLFAGRIVHEKGVKELIEAFTLIREELNNDALKLVLAGDIRKSDDPDNKKAVYGKRIRNLVRGRKDILLTDTIPPHRMPDFYAIGDFFVLPAIWNDPFPTVLVEAAAAGLPIVTTNVGGIPEFVKDKVNGIVLEDARDISDLSRKILLLLKNPELAGNIARNAREAVEHFYSWERVTDNIENFYLSVLDNSVETS